MSLEELDAQDLAEDQEVAPFKYSITSYGADYPIDGLVKRIRDGSIYIPSFQRGFVWTLPQASRFIESLLLGLPVPGIFLSKDDATQTLLVIDGQQRLLTLSWFYEGIFHATERVFALQGVQERFDGATYQSLTDEDRRRLDDSILHATVIKQEEPSEDESSVYYIFERLNTGGTPLRPQEIRTAIYHGPFNDLLHTLNQRSAWRALYGPEDVRMRDRELILRFLALFFRADSYRRPLKAFLNAFMGENRYLRRYSAEHITITFGPTADLIDEVIGARAFRPRRTINAAVFDAVMVGLARRLAERPIANRPGVVAAYGALLANEEFVALTESSTTGEESVQRRLALASQYFSDVA
jgi:hypothetical protein